MAISASFLWRFLDDVWDLLPSEDRELFETYWSAKIQVASNLEQKTIEASLSTEMARVPVYLTERWNRFVMDDSTCDLFTTTEEVILTGTAASTLSRKTAMYDSLQISDPSGQISYTQNIQFFDESIRSLQYPNIVKGTVSVKLGTIEFTQNRDYVVNRIKGTIQALADGRLPRDEVVSVTYSHTSYIRDEDYEVDEIYNTITRTSSSAIPDGGTVAVSYTYNATATVPLQGTNAVVGFATLTDEAKDFSTLLPERTLTVTDGPNAGTYVINDILSPTEIQITTSFPVPQDEVSYSINAFPHGMRISKNIASIPVLQDLVTNPEHVLLEGVDYRVQDGILALSTAFRLGELGPASDRVLGMWAEETLLNEETPYRNFGVLLDFYRSNSEAYKLALQGLWYAFWTGSTPGNLQRGIHILLGLPYALNAGTITGVTDTKITLRTADGLVQTYTIPEGVTSVVVVGDTVERFDSLTTGIELLDRNNTENMVSTYLGRPGVQRFLTSRATRGAGSTDETRALKLLEHHLFIPRIVIDTLRTTIDVNELITFLTNMKPAWTTFMLTFSDEAEEGVSVSENDVEPEVTINLSTTVTNNEWNQGIYYGEHLVASSNGEIIGGGTQATGNFRDLLEDMAALGVDKGDVVKILQGAFKGAWVVLERISTTTLALDIPDASIFGATLIPYEVHAEERGLSHDGVLLKREHINLEGTEFLTPSGLNTKTDADFVELTDNDVTNLLLVDDSNTGNEVQAITAADVANGELTVASAPTPGVQSHEICSAAVKRTEVSPTPGVTAYAI